MLGGLGAQMTATVQSWWTVLAGAPWLSLAAAIGTAVLLLLIGLLLGRLRKRRPAVADDRGARTRIAELTAERDRLRKALETRDTASAAMTGVDSLRRGAETARDAAVAVQKKLEADVRTARAETAAAQKAEAAATEAANAAESRARVLAERVAKLELRVEAAEARADATAARAVSAEADAETSRQALQEASPEALVRLATTHDAGQIGLAAPLAEAEAFIGRYGDAMAVALRLRALAALGTDAPDGGLAMAAGRMAAARMLSVAPDAATEEANAVLGESLEAARRMDVSGFPEPMSGPGGVAGALAGHMGQAGLMRLAEAFWLRRAEAPDLDPALAMQAQAEAAAAALWGGRWPQAIAIAARTLPNLAAIAEPKAVLDLRLTAAQASLFTGAPEAAKELRAIAEDAAETLGDGADLTGTAQRLAARAMLEQGEVEAADAFIATLRGGPIDPDADPLLRAARARGFLKKDEPKAARVIFDQLARAASKTPRAALGHRLDATEARLLDLDLREAPDGIDDLAKEAVASFGPRHPRAGQAALLRAMALELDDSHAAALDALDAAEALLAHRLDADHRWRRTIAEVRARLRGVMADIEVEVDERRSQASQGASVEDAGPAEDNDAAQPPDSRRGAMLVDIEDAADDASREDRHGDDDRGEGGSGQRGSTGSV